MRDDLQFRLCNGCGEKAPGPGDGILAMLNHSCPGNTVTYRPSRFTFKKLQYLITGVDPIKPFKDLLQFPHLMPMPDFETASTIDKILYSHARDSDIRTMKSLRAYIELEEELYSKY